MRELTAMDLLSLKHGDSVYRASNGGYDYRKLNYVGRMPRNEKYLIFSDGEYLTHLYISEKDNSFAGKYFGGKYDDKFVLNEQIKYHESMIEKLKEFLNED